jgi:hypothetical protein
VDRLWNTDVLEERGTTATATAAALTASRWITTATSLLLSCLATAQDAVPEPGDATLVAQACSLCHSVPPPDILPRRSWRNVIQDMAVLNVRGVGVPPDHVAPPQSFDFERVASYFENRAPQALPSPSPWPPAAGAPVDFQRESLGSTGAELPASIANVRLVQFDANSGPKILASDMLSGLVLQGDPHKPATPFEVLGRASNPVHAEVVDLDLDGRKDVLIADIGNPVPSDHRLGAVILLRARQGGGYDTLSLASGLPRVADAQAGDFDGDGDLDVVVAAFGWRAVGGILLLENNTKDWSRPAFAERVLDLRTGAIHVPVTDLDGDGRLDFVALISQHHEAVVAFLGDGEGRFHQEIIDRAPHPAWGSSGLQLVDIDGDGDQDALVTNGDMLDDFQLKPYHGIRWLENRGSFPFTPHEIGPMFCVMRAQAGDLDGDGDIDIAATALVTFKIDDGPTRTSPDIPSLLWLEQTASGHFERHILEGGSQHLSLDLGDYDGDGDTDILVANSLSGTSAPVDVWQNMGGTESSARP